MGGAPVRAHVPKPNPRRGVPPEMTRSYGQS